MNLSQFVESKEVYYGKNLVSADEMKSIERELGISFGKELSQYVLKYGYLGYKHIELYGLNSKQMYESDMIKQTKYLHKYFPKTADYIALENTGDGNYIVVSSSDDVFEYTSEDDGIHKMGMKLFNYILNRFNIFRFEFTGLKFHSHKTT